MQEVYEDLIVWNFKKTALVISYNHFSVSCEIKGGQYVTQANPCA